MSETPKLTPRQRLVLEHLNETPRTEGFVAKEAGIRTTWPSETAQRHLRAVKKLGLCHETKPGFWIIVPAGREALGRA